MSNCPVSTPLSWQLVVAVFLAPILWLIAMVNQYGIEPSASFPWNEALGYPLSCVATGCVAGLAWPGSPRLSFTLMVGIAGVFSWGIMFVVVGINSTSGHGIESGFVVLTVLSWVLAFVAFFGTAWLMRRCGPGTYPRDRDVPGGQD